MKKFSGFLPSRKAVTGDFRLLLLLFAHGVAVADDAQKKGPPPAPVAVQVAESRLLAPSAVVPGTVISRFDARIAAEVEGVVNSVAEVGQLFKQGDVLAHIDDTNTRLQVAEARANVARQKARLVFLAGEVDRLEKLSAQNSAAKTQLDLAFADRDVASSELDVASIRLEQAADQMARTQIRAPFAGVVVQRFKYQGERIAVGDVMLRFADPGALEVQANVSLQSINHLRKGMDLNVLYDQSLTQAKVKNFVPVGDEKSRLYELRLVLTDHSFSSGQTVRVEVPIEAARQVVAVPRDAMVLRNKGITIYKIDADNKAVNIPVQTGAASGDWIEVQGDIAPGDQVVVRGGERLRPGQSVTILNVNGADNQARKEGSTL